jgi:hypothetical protein
VTLLAGFALDSDLGSDIDEGFSDRSGVDDGLPELSGEDDCLSGCSGADDDFSDRSGADDGLPELSVENDCLADCSVEDDVFSDCSGKLDGFALFSDGEMDSPFDSIGDFALVFFAGGEMDSPFIICDFSTSAFCCGTSFNACVRFAVTVERKSRQRNELNGYRNI